MKKYFVFIILGFIAFSMHSCKDYLTAQEPGVTQLNDYFTSKDAAISNVTACYVPLMWEYNSTYYSEWFIGDIVSDDALKGGQTTMDMASVYDMENWKTTSSNELLLDFYRAQYQGIARCNLALRYVADMKTDTAFSAALQSRLLGEVYFLRAYYYFRLVRIFAGVPLTTKVLSSSNEWQMDRASVAEIYNQILDDLKEANNRLWVRSKYAETDLGRATKGAAQAMLLKTYLYMASPYWNSTYQLSESSDSYARKAAAWGDSIIASVEDGEYKLMDNYPDIFTLANENCQESVFEIQYAAVNWGDYNEGNGFTAGSFTQRLVRSRSSQISECGDAGWGFNHPTYNLYNEFEKSDSVRRNTAILDPDTAKMENRTQEIYLGSPLLNNKYGWYGNKLDHDSRGPLNNKQIRLADVYLMAAEANCMIGETGKATDFLNIVRQRSSQPQYGTYSFAVNGVVIDHPTLEQAIRHERRVELAMEGHRWFDIVRWGNVGNHMRAYQATESDEAKSHMGTFQEGKHEIFPIPEAERELNPMNQNPNY